MIPTILMSGPIRPSEADVLANLASLRRQFPGSRIFLSTWTDSAAIRNAVDVYDVCEEPSEETIRRDVPSTTRQHAYLPDTVAGGRLSMYRMVYGVRRVIEIARQYLSESDLVLRIRTDSFVEFDPVYLRSLLDSPPEYLAKRGNGFDWVAMTSFGMFQRVWLFQSLQQYNQEVSLAWNPEALIETRVPVPISYLDHDRVEMYVLKPNGVKMHWS